MKKEQQNKSQSQVHAADIPTLCIRMSKRTQNFINEDVELVSKGYDMDEAVDGLNVLLQTWRVLNKDPDNVKAKD